MLHLIRLPIIAKNCYNIIIAENELCEWKGRQILWQKELYTAL